MQNTILIIDGSSFVFRAFHAMPPLSAPNGRPTGATRGIINMFKLMQKKYPTKHWACVFDAPGKTFRDEIHPKYKANRAETPVDLISQMEDIYALIKAMGIPVIMQSGIEADDIIGSIAIFAKNCGMKVLIATGDKDFAQLVDEDITLINTMTDETLDIAGVINKFGVKPSQIIDYLSLVGDKVDNIPGVDKCGPKTAVKWLSEYGTIENLVQNADKIGGVVGENLRATINWLPTAKKLVTIDTKIELDHDKHIAEIDQLICKDPDKETLKKYYTELGFKTWLQQLESDVTSNSNIINDTTIKQTKAISKIPLEIINSKVQFESIVNNLISNANKIAILALGDEYPSPQNLRLISIATTDIVYILNMQNPKDSNDLFTQTSNENIYLSIVQTLFNSNLPKVLANAKETIQLLTKIGIKINNINGDLTLAHYLRNSKVKHTISAIFNEYLEVNVPDLPAINTKPGKDSPWLIDETCINNCYTITSNIIDLENTIRNELDANEKKLYLEVELPLATVLVEIESAGIMLDIAKFKLLEQELISNISLLEDKIYSEAKSVFNINSTKQLQDILFNQLKLPTDNIKKNSNGYSTDEDTLNILADEGFLIASYMLEYRTLSKLLNTYVSKLPLWVDLNHKVHTTFDQAFVASGRLSSRDPNLQNIPVKNDWGRQIRKCFIASPNNKLICADYSQIELRILAHISGDENLIHAFNTNQDIHSATASEIFHKPISEVSKDERRYAKTINFSLLYGKTVFGLAQDLKLDRATAKLYIDTYFSKYPKIKSCMENIKNFAHENGYVATAFGRKIYLANINSGNRIVRDAEERLALNAPMQGTSADIIKFAMIEIANWLNSNNLKTKMVLQVHDELILDVPIDEIDIIKANLPKLMTKTVTLKVQMEVDVKVADNWDDAH